MKSIRSEFILLSLFISVLFIIIRVAITHELMYVFLIWNLFLAWIPYQLSKLALSHLHSKGFIPWLLLTGWLIFFPNAPYIITDLFHLRQRPHVPLWFDTALVFLASWNGLLLGMLSLMNVERFLARRLTPAKLQIFLGVLFVLCSFGIYAGRYLRWNSWHVLTQPHTILADVAYIFMHPYAFMKMAGVTVIFSLLLMCCYYSIKSMVAQSRPDLP